MRERVREAASSVAAAPAAATSTTCHNLFHPTFNHLNTHTDATLTPFKSRRLCQNSENITISFSFSLPHTKDRRQLISFTPSHPLLPSRDRTRAAADQRENNRRRRPSALFFAMKDVFLSLNANLNHCDLLPLFDTRHVVYKKLEPKTKR